MSLQTRNANISGHRQLYAYHPTFGYTFTPSIVARCISHDPQLGGHKIQTDKMGFRNSPFINKKNVSEVIDVLIIGCSFAAGHGVDNATRFSDIFQAANPSLTVYNASLSGSGIDQQFLIANDIVKKKKVKKILFSPYPGCADRNLMQERKFYDPFLGRYSNRPKPFFDLVDGKAELCSLPIKKWGSVLPIEKQPSFTKSLLNHIGVRFKETLASNLGFEITRLRSYDKKNQYAHTLLIKILQKLVSLCKLHDIELTIMPLPARFDAYANNSPAYNRFFQSFSLKNDLQMIDLWRCFSSLPRDQLGNLFIQNDGHYTKDGHLVIASFIKGLI